jgi:ArsR family transcriptional regulator, arsenate/arsenite/antimonite-responsive transcriptional repressor
MEQGTTDTITLVDAVERTSDCCAPPTTLPRLADDKAKHAADLFKALADPARLQILDVLAQHGREVCVCDLEGIVGLPDAQGQRPKQPTISHHLRVLRDAGLVGYEKRGQWAYYYVHAERLDAAMALLAALRA